MPTATPQVPGYQLHRCLGAGGMGVVYHATRDDDSFQYALKMLLAGHNASIEDLVRFRIEAEAYACLNHPNIIKIRDVGTASGCPFLAMDFAANGTLKNYLKDNPNLGLEWRVRTIRKVVDALAHAHGRRILHRDLKPANILISADDEPRVSDFGLVKFSAPIRTVSDACCTMSVTDLDPHLMSVLNSRDRTGQMKVDLKDIETVIKKTRAECSNQYDLDLTCVDPNTVLDFVTCAVRSREDRKDLAELLDEKTQSGFIMGSPQYMSPEQAAGDVGLIAPPTDVYGLGATLYTVLTGIPPISGQSTYDVIRNVATMEPIPPIQRDSSIPEGLSLVVMKALAKKPEGRYPTMEMLGEDLDRVLNGKKTIAELNAHVTSRRSSIRSIIQTVSRSISRIVGQSEAFETTIVPKTIEVPVKEKSTESRRTNPR